MKKIIALVLSIVLVCCFSVTAFAAESPEAPGKQTITIRKAVGIDPEVKADEEFVLEKGDIITVKADEATYGKFNSWSIYKEETATGTSAPVNDGLVTLNVIDLAAKATAAVAGTDYEIIEGSLTTTELTVKINADVTICANYGGVITDPNIPSSETTSPSTGDMTGIYVAIIALAIVAFGFGVKKVYSK